jgi:polyisoprenyl-phosphate glycosyltransferase
MNIKLSIVVPVYNSQDILPELVQRIQKTASALGLTKQFELLLINDGSPDKSWSVIVELANRYNFLRGVNLRKNFGQHSATMAGLHYVRGQIIVIMDDDLQHPPEDVCELMRAVEDGADVCYVRYQERQHALWKIVGSRINNWAANLLLGKPRDVYLSSFKAMTCKVVEEVIKYDGPYAYLDGLILDVTRSIRVIDIRHQPRYKGSSNYNVGRSISLWLRMATSFSIVPLRLATVLGLSMAILSLFVIVWVVVYRMMHPEIPAGWASLIAVILFIGGVQTFCIGMLGEYLGRAYLKINRKPQFVVRTTTWKSENPT